MNSNVLTQPMTQVGPLKGLSKPLTASGLALGASIWLCMALVAVHAQAAPIQPKSDQEVIERLPASSIARRSAGRQAAVGSPTGQQAPSMDAATATQKAGELLRAARQEGDPRPAGQALALLSPWRQDPMAPAPLVVMLATVEQFLHQFEPATERLQALVQRDPRQAQAWLTLATLHRLKGDFRQSDVACQAVLRTGVSLHGQACLAENQALRGELSAARQTLSGLVKAHPADPAVLSWLWTTLAELEQRDGRGAAAEAAFQAALAAQPDSYTAVAYADWLLASRQPQKAYRLLSNWPRSDAVLLRLVLAGQQTSTPTRQADAAEWAEREAQAALRADAGHERERALYALEVQRDAAAALRLSARNLQHQREPMDLLIHAKAARAAKDEQALARLAQLKKEMKLHDRRLDALL